MISVIHQYLFYIHVACGSVGLIIFWLPMWSKKGSAFHKLYGNIFAYGMFAVSISGILMSLMLLVDPIGVRSPTRQLPMEQAFELANQNRELGTFLLMLSLLVFTNIKHSLLVLKAKNNRSLLKQPAHLVSVLTLLIAGIIVGYFALVDGNPLFMIFSLISIISSMALCYYIFKKSIKKREWLIEHLGNIIGAGIGAYTAFFAFGGRQIFEGFFTGQLQIIPWIIPGIVGGISSYYLTKKYRLQYKVA